MISLGKGKSVAAALAYFDRHLQVGDYYSQDASLEGMWRGQLAKRLGLEGQAVNRADLAAVLEGRFSEVGDSGMDRSRRSELLYFDLCYSPPKSVAILAALDERIAKDIRWIVDDAWKGFERDVAATRDASGRDEMGKRVYETKKTGEMIAAEFVHNASRVGDPGLHFHRLVVNATYDQDRRGIYALDAREMFRLRKQFDYEIQSNVAKYFLERGYTTVVGKSGMFEVGQVPSAAIDLFSRRHIEVKKRFAELRLEQPNVPDHILDQLAVLETRPQKVVVSDSELREDVIRRMQEAGLTIGKPAPGTDFRMGIREVMVNAVASMVRDVFTGETVVTKSKVVSQLLKYGRGLINRRDADQLLSYDDRFMDLPGERGGRVMFRPHVKIERELCSVGCSLLTPYHSLIHPKASLSGFPPELSLEPDSIDKAHLQAQLKGEDISRDELIRSREQFRAAYQNVMEGKESLFFIEGAAGVGKSFFLGVLKQGIEATGKQVFAVAPTGRASRENLAGDFENPQTIQHLILNKKMQCQLRGNVLIVDEAPLADGGSLNELLKVCKEQECKVILQGDLKQQHAVAAIDSVRLLVKELGLGTKLHRLNVSRRQLKWEDKEIARTWSHGHVKEAIDLMIATGTVVEAKPDEGMASLAKQYVEALSRNETAMVVSSTHAQGDELTKKIRQERKAAGQIGMSDGTVRTDRELSDGAALSNGEKFFADSPTSYRLGMRLALKNRPGRADQVAGDKWEVVGLHDRRIEIKRGNSSRVIDVTKERMADYAVYEPRELALTTGDRVRLQEKIVVSTQNRSSYQKINGPRAKEIYERGSIQTVASWRDDGSIVFKSGLVVNANDGRLAQGYVSTSIPAQGSTVDWLFCYESVKSLKALANLASMYVNVSRHVKGMNFFTESIDALRTWGDRKHDRELALEAERHARLEAQELKLRHPNREVEFTVLPQSDEPKPAPVPTPSPARLATKPIVETVLPTQPTVKPSRLVALDDSPIPAPPPTPSRIIPTIIDSSQQDKKSAAYREITKQLIEERLKSYTPKPPEKDQPEVEFS